MDELVLWLGEQLDEDERIARAAGGRSEQTWQADVSGVDPIGGRSWPLVVRYVTGDQLRGAVAHLPVMQERSEDRMAHIAAHDPARVLREIAAKRDLLVFAKGIRDHHETFTTGVYARLEKTLRLFALAYADRVGYREEWRP